MSNSTKTPSQFHRIGPVRTLAEVAAIMGISKGRVGQLEANALRKLRKRFAEYANEGGKDEH